MKKLLRNIIMITSSLIMAVGVTACGKNDDKNNDKNNNNGASQDSPKNTVTESTEHLVTNGLHKVNVTESDRAFVVNDACDYKILYHDDEQSKAAASFIQQHVLKATGVRLTSEKIEEDYEYVQNSKIIVINGASLFAAAGLTMPAEDLGTNGYYIKNAGNSYFIANKAYSGAQSGAIAFLKYLIGYEMYSADTVVYDRSGATIPDMDITEKPDFEFRVQGNRVSTDAIYGMGFQSSGNLFISVEGETWHNSLNFLPKETYQARYPEWYSTKGNEICYTARGNEEKYNEMVDTVAQKMVAYSDANPSIPNICFTIEDHNDQCGCEACAASRTQYGGADSAAVVKFINAVNRKVQAALLEKAGGVEANKRHLNILFFAYRKMEKAPVTYNSQTGRYTPIDETVICDENVGVYIAPIDARYNKSFYDDDNQSAKQLIEGWGALSGNLYMWLYETNYSHYMYPLNSYDTMIETYRFCKANNAVYMMNEGQYNQGNVTHFGKLKEYFNARAEFNVNDNYADIVDDFFAAYFRDAAEPMREYFDQLQAHLRYLEEAYPADVNGNIYNPMEQSKLWSYGTLNGWLKLIDKAYAAVEKYKDSDPELYSTLVSHIKLESLFPRFAVLRLYGGMFSKAEVTELRTKFREDCSDFNVSQLSETVSLDTVYKDWGI